MVYIGMDELLKAKKPKEEVCVDAGYPERLVNEHCVKKQDTVAVSDIFIDSIEV